MPVQINYFKLNFSINYHTKFEGEYRKKVQSLLPREITPFLFCRLQSPHKYGCEYYNYNYSFLNSMSFEKAFEYVHSLKGVPEMVPCTKHKFENTESVVSQVSKGQLSGIFK